MEPMSFCEAIAQLENWGTLSDIDYNKRCSKLLVKALEVNEKSLKNWRVTDQNSRMPQRYKNQLKLVLSLKMCEASLRNLGLDSPTLQTLYVKTR
jgi:hypothetical protein